MARQRFRKIKQDRHKGKASKSTPSSSDKEVYASAGSRIKAFLTDAFMLLMPIMYVVFYLVMEGREGFAEHRMLGWLYILLPLVTVQTLFMFLSGQTPGYRAYSITLIDERTKEKPSLLRILCRNIIALFSFFTLVGWVLMFFRKDYKTLHDLLCATAVVTKK